MSKDTERVHRKTCYGKFDIDFDIEEAKESNILVSGTNHTGKSMFACGICSILRTFNWKIVAVDNTGIWRQISDVPTFYIVRKERNYDYEGKYWYYPFPHKSMIFDTSLLIPDLQKSFTNQLAEDLWNFQVSRTEKRWTILCLEEAQLHMRNLRGSVSQNIMRVMSAGRNQHILVLAITVDLALIDPSFIRLCQQRYHARLGIEENSKRKFRNYYGLDWCRIATEGLDLGFFIYLLRNKLKVINVPCFETKRIPKPFYIPKPLPKPQPKSLWTRIREWLS